MGLAREGDGSGRPGWRAQLMLRGAGAVLLAAAWWGGRWLIARFAHGAAQGGGDTLAVVVSALVCAATSAGMMMATLGPALIRRYAVSARYRRHDSLH